MRAWGLGLVVAIAACDATRVDPLAGGGPVAPPRGPTIVDAGAMLLASDAAPRRDAASTTEIDAGVADSGARDAAPRADARTGEDARPREDAQAGEDAAAAPDAAAPDAEIRPDGGAPGFSEVDLVKVYLNLGDSVADGSNASSGRGYARLVYQNNAAYPAYAMHNLEARFGELHFVNRGSSGAKSDDVADQARALPDDNGGDAIVTIHVGGNDFNDDIRTMISEAATTAAIAAWEQNMTTVMNRLRAQYVNAQEQRTLVVLIANIHDPTGGLGTVPAGFTSGFCQTLHSPLLTPAVRQLALQNLARFNEAIRAFAARNGARLIDTHALFLAHGMNAAASDRWIDTDCTHPTNEGHHQLRREIWRLLSGSLF